VVRVNLLPERKTSRARGPAAEPGQLWVLMVLGFVVLEVVALLFVEKFKQDELKKITDENAATNADIAKIQSGMADHAAIKAQLKDLKEREEAVKKLKEARTGPTAVLLELSNILTPGNLPTAPRERIEQVAKENDKMALHPNWDTRRLWLTSYNELERSVKLGGLAREPEDISEFFRRLSLSSFFADVRLLPGNKIVDATTKQELVHFDISAKVRY